LRILKDEDVTMKNKPIIQEKSSEKVAKFLEKNSLHKKDFAEMIGVTLSYVYNLIDNSIPFSTRGTTLERIATVMEIEPEEFEDLLKIYNRYPLEELIVHPRLQKDFYKNTPNLDVFAMAAEESRNPLCYNGDITTVEEYERFCERFPTIEAIMIGRGLIANPGLVREIQTGEKMQKDEFELDFVCLCGLGKEELDRLIPSIVKNDGTSGVSTNSVAVSSAIFSV